MGGGGGEGGERGKGGGGGGEEGGGERDKGYTTERGKGVEGEKGHRPLPDEDEEEEEEEEETKNTTSSPTSSLQQEDDPPILYHIHAVSDIVKFTITPHSLLHRHSSNAESSLVDLEIIRFNVR